MEPRQVSKLYSEVSVMRELDHPHIVRMREVFYSKVRKWHPIPSHPIPRFTLDCFHCHRWYHLAHLVGCNVVVRHGRNWMDGNLMGVLFL